MPLGTTRATYVLIPWRGDLTGPASNQVSVQFGVESPPVPAAESGNENLGLAA